MIRRIALVNFMSHARTVIEPAEGLTVLVGPNNCGKSAVVAALQILCHNDNSTYVTRHNEKECSVTVETDDGHVVEWRRKNNSPRYTINGQLFDRLERGGIPENLHDVLRLAKVTADGNREFDVHFGEQKSPVFLVDKPGSYAAQFFASSSDTASLIEMQKRHQQKMLEARRERVELERGALKLAIDLDALSAADQIEIDVQQAELQYEELAQLTSHIGQLTQDSQALDQVMGRLQHHQAEATACGELVLPPTLENPQPIYDLNRAMSRTQLELERQSARAIALSSLPANPDLADERLLAELIGNLQFAQIISLRLAGQCAATHALFPPPVMIEFDPLRIMLTEIEMLGRNIAASEQRLAVLAPLVAVPELDDEIFLSHDVQSVTRASAAMLRVAAVHDQLENLAPMPDLVETREIAAAVAELNRAADAVNLLNQLSVRAQRSLLEGEDLLRTWAEQQQLCPTCGSTLDPNLIVVHAGSCVGGSPNA